MDKYGGVNDEKKINDIDEVLDKSDLGKKKDKNKSNFKIDHKKSK